MTISFSNTPVGSQLLAARKFVAVTASDSTDLGETRALWIGTGGNVAVIGIDDSAAVTIPSVPDGSRLDIAVKKVMLTNTTASGIVAWY